MKICFIVGAFPNMKCGVGDYTSKLADEMGKNGNEVSIITSSKASNFYSNNIKVYNIINEWNFRNLKLILRQLKEINPDVVNIQYPNGEYKKNLMINFLPFFIKKSIKCILIETVHEYSIFTILGKIRNFISFIKADEIIVVEEEYINEIKKLNKRKKIVFIPIASNIKQSMITEEGISKTKNELAVGDCKLISYFGFAIQSKGIEDLLYAIKEIPEAKLLFLGELNKQDEYQRSLINLIKELKIEERVIITGFLNEEMVADYLKSSDVCVLPFKNGVSKRNGSFLAAYNQNIPIVTTTKDRTFEKDGVYYTQINNRKELINNIIKALDYKEKINREIITWDFIAKKYIERIQSNE